MKRQLCSKLHPKDLERLKSGKLKWSNVKDLRTEKNVTVLDLASRIRCSIGSYDDYLNLINHRAELNDWHRDDSIISSLWEQIKSGETVLSIGGKSAHKDSLVRHVDGVNVKVIYKTPDGQWLQLVEKNVKYINEATARERPYSYVAGKSYLKEPPHKTACREVGEELNIRISSPQLKPQGLRVLKRNSPLTPGLMSVYYFRMFSYEITDKRDFKPAGYTSDFGGVSSEFSWLLMDEVEKWTSDRLISKVKDEIFPDW
jgi:hypothetical protein